MAVSVRVLRPGPIGQWDFYPLTIAAEKVARLWSVPTTGSCATVNQAWQRATLSA